MDFHLGSVVKNPPAKQETQGQSLGWDDPLEKEVATHSSILAWKIPWTEESGGLQSTGLQKELDTTSWLNNNKIQVVQHDELIHVHITKWLQQSIDLWSHPLP